MIALAVAACLPWSFASGMRASAVGDGHDHFGQAAGADSLLEATASREAEASLFPLSRAVAHGLLAQGGAPPHTMVALPRSSAVGAAVESQSRARTWRTLTSRLHAQGFPAEAAPHTDFGAPLARVSARDGAGLPFDLDIPEEWALKLQTDSIRLVRVELGRQVYSVRIACDPDVEVEMRIEKASPALDSELLALERLHSPGVAGFFEKRAVGNVTYILEEATRFTLNDVFMRVMQDPPRSGQLFLPLTASVPVLIDLLRGARDLAAAGVVHANISPKSVSLSEDGRALMSGFRGSSVITHRSVSFGAPLGAVAYRHAPETLGGYPNALSNNVWAVGTVFAEMCFGYLPVRRALLQKEPELEKVERKGRVREHIRRYASAEFSIASDEQFRRLGDAALKDLISALLTTDSEQRVSAEVALQMALRFAERAGIEVRPERDAPRLPTCWNEWQ